MDCIVGEVNHFNSGLSAGGVHGPNRRRGIYPFNPFVYGNRRWRAVSWTGYLPRGQPDEPQLYLQHQEYHLPYQVHSIAEPEPGAEQHGAASFLLLELQPELHQNVHFFEFSPIKAMEKESEPHQFDCLEPEPQHWAIQINL
jgi:hypothetical protein